MDYGIACSTGNIPVNTITGTHTERDVYHYLADNEEIETDSKGGSRYIFLQASRDYLADDDKDKDGMGYL